MTEQNIWNVVQVLFVDGGTYVTADVIASCPTLAMAQEMLKERIHELESKEYENWLYDGHRYNAFFLIDEPLGRTIQLSVEPSVLQSIF